MDRTGTKPLVVARIPDLSPAEHRETRRELPPSTGRLIGQALSFKLLSATMLLLVVAATLSSVLGRNSRSTASSTSDVVSEWRPGSDTSSADVAPRWTPPAAEVPAVVPTAVNRSPTPTVVRPVEAARESPAAVPVGAPRMSVWPNPAYPITAQREPTGDEPHAGANQAMAIRPAEYDRNSYDRTRSSIH